MPLRNNPSQLLFPLVVLILLLEEPYQKIIEKWGERKKNDKVPGRWNVVLMNFASAVFSWTTVWNSFPLISWEIEGVYKLAFIRISVGKSSVPNPFPQLCSVTSIGSWRTWKICATNYCGKKAAAADGELRLWLQRLGWAGHYPGLSLDWEPALLKALPVF